MCRIMNIVLLREMADKAITISTRGLAGARRPKHANMTISQNTSILRKGLAIELWGYPLTGHIADITESTRLTLLGRVLAAEIKLGGKRISPTAFMRELRSEKYSDTRVRSAYQLEPDIFEYRLDTITSRNETHDFELFCRKICERTICPNLRPQTGPEGGGDSKVDSETLPVADEIATRDLMLRLR
jgi:hypothetical protein